MKDKKLQQFIDYFNSKLNKETLNKLKTMSLDDKLKYLFKLIREKESE